MEEMTVRHKVYKWRRRCWECGKKTNERYTVITPLRDHLNLCKECAYDWLSNSGEKK